MKSVLCGTGARLSRRVRRVLTLGGREMRRKIVTAFAIIAMLIQVTPWRSGIARAATSQWSGAAGDSSWDTAGNWSLGVPTSGDDAIFPAIIPGGNATINLNGGDTANNLSFANAYILNSGDLTLTTGNITVAPTFTARIDSILAGGGGITLSADNGLAGADALVGGGTLLLTNTNTYSGPTTINAGTLAFNNLGALGTGDVTVNTGGTLENRFNGGNVNNGVTLGTGATYSYLGTGQSNFAAGKVVNLLGNSTINNLNPGTSGKIFLAAGQLTSDPGVVLTKTGAGVLQFAGAMPDFHGSVVVNGGFTEFQNVDSLGTGTTDVTVNNGGEFVASGTSVRHNFTVNTGGTLSANGNGSATYTGPINLAGNANIQLRLFQTQTTPNAMQIRGTLSGPGNLNVSAPVATTTAIGSLLLSGNNAGYANTITINPNAQVRGIQGAGQDGLGAAAISLNGGTLGITPVVSPFATEGFSGRYYNSTTAILGNGIIGGYDFGSVTPQGTRVDSTIDVPNNPTGFFPTPAIAGFNAVNIAGLWTGVLNINSGGAYTFTTQSDDGSMLYIDGQPVVINDFSQGFTARSGLIDLTAGAHSIIVKYSNGGTGAGLLASYNGPDTGGTLTTIGSISGTVSNNGSTVFGPTTIDNNITLGAGRSAIDLSGTNATNSGTLTLGSFSTLLLTGQTGGESLTQQGAMSINGFGTVMTGLPQQLNGVQQGSAGADLIVSNPIADAGSDSLLVKDGPRTLRFGSNNVWNGRLSIAGGNVDLNGFNGSFSAIKAVNNTPVAIGNTETISTGTGTLTLASDVFLSGSSAGAITFSGNLDLGGANRTFYANAATNSVISATMSNGSLTKAGYGGLTISGNNTATYTGVTTINSGKLTVASAGALGSTAANTVVNAGGYLDVANVTTAEPLVLNGHGVPVPVTGINTYGGPQYSGALQGSGGFSGVVSGPITLGSDSGIGVGAGNLLTVSGVISDGGSAFSLTKEQGSNVVPIGTGATSGGAGILKLTGQNTYTGATIVRGGDLYLASPTGSTIQSTNIIIGDGTADATLTMVGNFQQFPTNAILTFAGGSKNAKFQLNGTTQTVAGFSVTGTLPFIQNHENGAAATPGTLIVDNPLDTTFAGEIRNQNGVLNLVKRGVGTMTLSGDGARGTGVGTYTGSTTISGGKFLVSDSTTFSSPVTITAASGGQFEVFENNGRTMTYGAVLTDNGAGFTKSGDGTLALSGVSVVTGTVQVKGGVLSLQGSANNLAGAPINVAAGTQLQFNGVSGTAVTYNNNITLNGLTPGGALSGAVISGTPNNTLTGTLTLAATSNVSTGWADKTFRMTGKITGPGGLQFDKLLYTQQPPVFQASNTGNDYAGGTTINAGTVYFAEGALPASGLLTFGGYNTQSSLNTLIGPNLALGVGAGGLASFSRSIGTGAGQVAFTGEGGGFSAIGGKQTITFGGAATPQLVDWGGAGFSGNASLFFNGSNTLGGTSAFNADSEVEVTNDIVLSGAGLHRVFVVDNNGSGGDQVRFSGSISGPGGLLKDGGNSAGGANLGGTLILSGANANTYTGLTNVQGGTLILAKTAGVNAIAGDLQISNNAGGTRRIVQLGASDQIADSSVITFVGSTANNGDLRMFGFNETVAGISDRSGGGIVEVVDNAQTSTGNSTLTVNGNSDSFYNGFFRDVGGTPTVGGTLSLVKGGTGTLTISAGQQSGSGNASYSGATSINSGKLVYSNLTTFNSTPTIAAGATLEFAESVNQAGTFGKVIGGDGQVIKSGLGTIALGAANTYTGTTTVSGGTLTIGSGATGSISDLSNIINNGTVGFNRNNAYTYLGVISGSGGVTNFGANSSIILGGANTYTGVTTANAGTLILGGSGAAGVSAGGLVLNSGGTLSIDFNQPGASQAGIVAAGAPVTLAGGSLNVLGNTGSVQSLGAVTVNRGVSSLNVSGDIALTTGAFARNAGGVVNFSLPGGASSVKVGGAGLGGILGGWAVTTGTGATFVAIDGAGNLTPLSTFDLDTWSGGNVAVSGSSSQSAGAVANSLYFNNPSSSIVTLDGGSVSRITSGGILVTSNVGGSDNTITGGTLTANGADLIVHQQNTLGSLTIESIIADNVGPTGLTKSGGGTLILNGANTYTGNTAVLAGTVVMTNPLSNLASTTVASGSTLQLGDGVSSNGPLPTSIVNNGTVIINDPQDQALDRAFNASGNFNFTNNSIANPTSSTTGTLIKNGAGTLTITGPVLASQFHQKAGTTILDTGANVVSSSFNSIGLNPGDTAVMNIRGAGKFTQSGDFNVADQTGTTGTLNLSDIGQVIAGNLFVGKSGTAVGVVNQTGGSVSNSGGSNDWRIGGMTGTGDAGAQGTYNLSAGTFQTARNFQIGASGHGVFNQTGGSVSVTGGFNVVGRFVGGVGELNMSNGSYTVTTGNRMIIGEAGTGTVNVSGNGQLLFTATAAGSGLGLGSNNAGAGTGVINLNGGLIQTPQVVDQNTNGADGSSTFNFNGGVLRVTGGSASGATFMTGLTNAFVKSGGAFIDTNGVATTIGQALLTDPNDSSGGLTKLNTGTLTLTSQATYGGPTSVNGGVLQLNFAAAAPTTDLLPSTGTLVINGGGLLVSGKASTANSQTFSGVTLNGTGTIAGTIGTSGTVAINLNNITQNTASAVDFSIPTGVTMTTTTANQGTSILGGWATVNGGAGWAVSGSTGGTAGNITALGTYVNDTWAAGNNTTVTASATRTNLTTNSLRFNAASALTLTMSGTDTITTGGLLVTPTVVGNATTITGGTLTASGDLVVSQYNTGTLTLTSILAQPGALVKMGGGTTILNAADTYGGDTIIGAGTLRIAAANRIPDGSSMVIHAGASFDLNNAAETIDGLSGYGSVVNSAAGTPTLTVGSSGASTTFSGQIVNGTGNVALTKTGGGILTLNNVAAGSYTGNTTINNGSINIATPNALSNNTLIVVNSSNGLVFDTTIPVISALAGNSGITLTTQSTNAPVQLTVGNNNNGNTYTGGLSGSGTLIKIGSGVQIITGSNSNDGGFVANGGVLALTGNNFGSGSMYAAGGTIVVGSPSSFIGDTARNVIIANGGALGIGSVTANPQSSAFPSFGSALARIDRNSSGVFALSVDGSLQTPITEDLDFSAAGPGGALNLSLGAVLSGAQGVGNAPVIYTGVITPNGNTLRIGGSNGRLVLTNGATLAGANEVNIGSGGSQGGQLFLQANFGYTGPTTINSGTTIVASLTNGGAASTLGASSSAASNLVLNGGTLQYVGNGASTNRLFTLTNTPTAIDASGTAPLNFTNTGAIGLLNSGNRVLTLQGSNTGNNTLSAAIGDALGVAGANGVVSGNGTTAIQKSGNGTWVLNGTNTFTGGVNISNGVLVFAGPNSIGGNTANGPASVSIGTNGAAALGAGFNGGLQAALNRISPLSTGTVALTANTSENLNFEGGRDGATLPTAFLGAYGNVTYTGTLTPAGSVYRLGGGGGVLTMPNGGLTGPRSVQIAGGGPGSSLVNNQNLNGVVVLGGVSDYSGGTQILPGGVLSTTSAAALGSGPLKFQGGVYRVSSDSDDITVAADGSAREIRIGIEASGNNQTANIDVPTGINATFSKPFGPHATFGANLGTEGFTKFGGGNLVLAGGMAYNGTTTVERGTLTLMDNPSFYGGNVQVGSNNGGVGTLKLGADNFFASGPQFGSGNVVDLYTGSKLDLNGFSDTIRFIRGMGSIVNTGATSANLSVGTNNELEVIGGHLEGNFNLTVAGNVTHLFGTGSTINSLELWNNDNSDFTGKLVVNGGGLRIRSDGSLGASNEPFKADKITLNNGAVLLSAGGTPVVIGANHGITLGATGGTIWQFNTTAMVINAPITGAGQLSIGDDTGAVLLASDNNNYAGGTEINSNAAARGMLSIGAGGATGSLPAGDVFFNSSAGGARLYFFKSSDMTLANTFNGPGQIMQIGSGTTTLTGQNNTNQTTFVGGGRLRADFTDATKSPIGAGTNLQISSGTFEYVAPAGDNALRLGTLTATNFGTPTSATVVGGVIGDATVQSTYGGSGVQQLIFAGNTRGTAGVTVNFVTSGGVNGTTNRIEFTSGPVANNVIGAAYFFNGSDFAAYDQGGFVRAANYGSDLNTAPINTMVGSRYVKLTQLIDNQPAISVPGINLGAGGNLNMAGNLTMNGNPGTLMKTGGGTSVIGGGASINTNNQELIVRTETDNDTLQIDLPIIGTAAAGLLTKSGAGTLILTAPNTYIGNTLLTNGTLLLTQNGQIGSLNAANGSEMRIALTAGQTATLKIDSPNASFSSGATNNGFRVGELGNGVVLQSDGTINAANFAVLGESLGSTGLYNISGGTLNVRTNAGAAPAGSPSLVVGRAGTGTMNISGNAVVNVMNGAQFMLANGNFNSGNFQGLVANAGISTGVGTVNQTGGTVNVDTTSSNPVYQGNLLGAVVIGVDGVGTYNLNGGSLNTPILARGNGTANFNLGGGTLRATAPTLNVDLPINLTGTGAGKGTIDTGANDLTFTSKMTGPGGFAKVGAGNLTVLGNSTYTGPTDINEGSVTASGSGLGNGAVTVASGATLNVQGQQQGLLARFFLANKTDVNPNVSAGSANMSPEVASLENFNSFVEGKAMIAAESTTARGKLTVDYLEAGGANGNTALPPALIAAQNGSNPFVAHVAGKFNAPTSGDYTFSNRSDDGTVMWIDGQPILDNNRSQGVTTPRNGTVNLSAGPHDIVIGYYQGTGGSGFSVGVTLPGQGQGFTIGSEQQMSNALLSYGNNLKVKSLNLPGGVTRLASGPFKQVLTVGDNTSATNPLSISGNGKVDITTNALAVNFAPSTPAGEAAVLASVRSQIISGYGPAKNWQGDSGITSANTIAEPSSKAIGYALASEVLPFGSNTTATFMGETVDKTTVLARYTLPGDATLDGVVDFNDLVKLAQSYNTTVSATTESWWNHGDFNYDGVNDFNDLVKLAQNYNTGLAPSAPVPGASVAFEADMARAFASVPEPGTMSVLAIGALTLLKRRRR